MGPLLHRGDGFGGPCLHVFWKPRLHAFTGGGAGRGRLPGSAGVANKAPDDARPHLRRRPLPLQKNRLGRGKARLLRGPDSSGCVAVSSQCVWRAKPFAEPRCPSRRPRREASCPALVQKARLLVPSPLRYTKPPFSHIKAQLDPSTFHSHTTTFCPLRCREP